MRFINFFFKVYLVIYDDFYDEKEFYNKKFLKLLVFEKNVFFEKLGLSANRIVEVTETSLTFFFGFFPLIEFSTSLY